MSFLDDEDEPDEEQAQEPGGADVVTVESTTQDSTDDGSPGLVKPVADDLEEIAQSFESFQKVKTQLLEKDDLQSISGNTFITKSGWRKIATAFGVSTNVTSKEREVGDGVVTISVTARAEAPNGQAANGVASCSSNESNFTEWLSEDQNDKPDTPLDGEVAWIDGAWRRIKPPRELKEHDVYATAATRAKNRAISDLVGGGDVSAEELDADHFIG